MLTRTRPPDDDVAGLAAFAKAETAKRRLLFELLDLGLPVEERPLRFDLLSEPRRPGRHRPRRRADHDRPRRVRRRAARAAARRARRALPHDARPLPPRDRPLLLADPRRPRAASASAARALFGDERADYDAALERHYAQGPPPDWSERHVSAYAAMHPWEDWAETFAHYLHIRDTLQTAGRVRAARRRAGARPSTGARWRRSRSSAGRATVRADHRRVAAAHLRAQRGQPQHGSRRPVSIHPRADGHRQARRSCTTRVLGGVAVP